MNLSCLKKTMEWNLENGIHFFRISSETIPFASHSICKFAWQDYFKQMLGEFGFFIKENGMRVCMHPGQFVVVNSKNSDVIKNSVNELLYHAKLLDAMELDLSAKIQVHLGGVYGNKEESFLSFIENYRRLPEEIRRRIVIENDEKNFSVSDCVFISHQVHVPVVFDAFHHSMLHNGETALEAFCATARTWRETDGPPIMDYSQQEPGARKGTHANSLDINEFSVFVKKTKYIKYDMMLEIKDKEKSALKAMEELKRLDII